MWVKTLFHFFIQGKIVGLLLLDRAQLELKSEGDVLVLYEAGQRRSTVPIKLIDRCVIHGSQTKLDTGVLAKLAEAGATTMIMAPRSVKRAALVLGPQHNDAAVRLAQAAEVLDDNICITRATHIVLQKLKRQAKTLGILKSKRPAAKKPLSDAIESIKKVISTLELLVLNPTTAAMPSVSLANLRGYEGASARIYFDALTHVFAPQLTFTGRNRRPPKDPVNVGLSLSYTMLHFEAVKWCVTAGLDPMLGFYHKPAFGRESLASDLIEPLRPVIDLWIWEKFRSETLRADHFSNDKGACLMGKAGRQIFYASWENECKPWRRYLRQQARLLAQQLRGRGAVLLSNDFDDEEI